MPSKRSPAERFWPKVKKTATCWLWLAYVSKTGYGRFFTGDATKPWKLAHVWVWEHLHGPKPIGTDLDHVRSRGCTSRSCVNPDHLELVSRSENIKRGRRPEQLRALKYSRSHCPHGHPYDEGNTYLRPDGARACKTCVRANGKKYRNTRGLTV